MSSYKKQDEPNKNDDLIKLLKIYLSSYNKYESNFNPELEVRFMTKSKTKIERSSLGRCLFVKSFNVIHQLEHLYPLRQNR